MKTLRTRILSIFIAIVMLAGLLPVSVIAASSAMTAAVSSETGTPGAFVKINIDIKNSPALSSLKIDIDYGKDLTLTAVEFNKNLGNLVTAPEPFSNPQSLSFISPIEPKIIDGTFATLTFRISETAKDNTVSEIKLKYDPNNIFNDNGNIPLNIVNGKIKIFHGLPGDINGDKEINHKDTVLLFRYTAGWQGLTVDPEALDCNGDNAVNNKDAVLLFRYVAGWPVKIERGKIRPHTMEAIPYKAATCTEDGHIAYWHCTTCEKYFKNSEGTDEITLTETVLASKGHTVVIDPAVEPTYTHTGLTEGKHCAVCRKIITPQEVIPKLEKNAYSITYNINNNDNYLKTIDVKNTNPSTYYSEDGLELKDLIVDGYNFKGWFTSQTGGSPVKEISVGEKGNKVLYAHWEKVIYTIQFDSPEVPVKDAQYTVDKGLTLINPSWFGYTFVGWSINGKIVQVIPQGTTGNLTLHANWTSNRNKTKSYSTDEKPIIIEDADNSRFLFVYEIGAIENVPLAEIEYIGNSNGIKIDKEYSYTKSLGQGFADTIAKTVSNATTKTSSWTLSEDWNKTTSAENSHDEQRGKTEEQVDSNGNVKGSKYYVSNCSGGASSSSSSSGGNSSDISKVTNGNSTGISGSYTNDTKEAVSVELHSDLSASGKVSAGGVAEASTTTSIGASIEGSLEAKQSVTNANSRNVNHEKSGTTAKEKNWISNSSSESTWNSTNSYENSASESHNTSVSNAISNIISDKYSYTSTESEGGNKSTTQSTGSSQALKDEYTSTVEYSTQNTETIKKTISYSSEVPGYYRIVTAGTVHVFAVVGYDIATNSYFTYTYNILDKNRYEYLDYSKSNASFNDCENGILPFEIPYYVNEYISNVINRTDGLTVNLDTGYITEYTGTAENVVIPEYISVNNGDGTFSAKRIQGIMPDVFKGNTKIKGVLLPKYIAEIPDDAFNGCTNLEYVCGAAGLQRIGKNAFKNCTSLKPFNVDRYITSLGANAFENVPDLTVMSVKASVADAAINSGAKKITLNLSHMTEKYDNKKICVSVSTNYFGLISNGTAYNNLQIDSNANETFISNIKFTNNNDTPLKINSDKVTLNRVSVEKSPGFALILSKGNTQLNLFGSVSLSSKDANTFICKNTELLKSNPEIYGSLNVTGNVLVCGEIKNTDLLKISEGKLIELKDSDFDSYITSSKITFNGNGGTLSEKSKTVYYGQSYGTLPVPVRNNYTFTGWYTAQTNGDKVTSDTKVTSLSNQTLYAHWSANKFTVTFNANGGSCSTSTRTLTFGDSYGSLPNASRNYYSFEGWYTASSSGQKISSSNVPSSASNITLYAHWKEHPVVGWVKESAMPSGAKIVSSKWTYTQRSYTTSSSSSKSGWTKYDTKRTSWGSTHGPVYSNPSNGSRNVWDESYETDRTHHWVYYRWRNPSNDYGSDTQSRSYSQYQEFDLTYKLTEKGSKGVHSYGVKYWHDNQYDTVWYSKEYDDIHYGTRWYYQDPVYTYYFYKDENKESSSKPSGSNISNTQRWVKYRAK